MRSNGRTNKRTNWIGLIPMVLHSYVIERSCFGLGGPVAAEPKVRFRPKPGEREDRRVKFDLKRSYAVAVASCIRRAAPETRMLALGSGVISAHRREGMPMSSPWMISMMPSCSQ